MSATKDPDAGLRAKLVAVISKCPTVVKGNKNAHLKSSYANLSDVMEAIKPVLKEAKCEIYQPLNFREGRYTITTIFADHDGYSMTLSDVAIPVNENAKNSAQDLGSGVSYMRRYALMSALALVATEDDDDGHRMTRQPVPKVTKQEIPLGQRQKKAIVALKEKLGRDLTIAETEFLTSTDSVEQLTEVYNSLLEGAKDD